MTDTSATSEQPLPIKAKLTIVLKADDKIIAESTDTKLWFSVMQALTQTRSEVGEPHEPKDLKNAVSAPIGTASEPLALLARDLSLTEEQLRGTCDPSTTAPFLHLDHHSWADWFERTPRRGKGSVSPTAIAGTLLCLWFRRIGSGNPSMQQIADVLETVGFADPNAARAIKNSEWLQLRDGHVQLNAAKIRLAASAARIFCGGEISD